MEATLCPDCPSSSFVGWECAAECAILEDCEDCQECRDGEGESVGMECCDSFDCLLPSPALSATRIAPRIPTNAQGEHHSIKPLQYAQGLALDCNQCSETTQIDPHARPYLASGHVTPANVAELATAPIAGLGELLGGLDGKVIEEILNCCCCGPESASQPPTHECYHVPHQPTPPQSSRPLFDPSPPPPHQHYPSFTTPHVGHRLPGILDPRPPTPTHFYCKWQDCGHSFLDQQSFITHVNHDHLLLPIPLIPICPAFDPASLPFVTKSIEAGKCLWDDCTTALFLPPLPQLLHSTSQDSLSPASTVSMNPLYSPAVDPYRCYPDSYPLPLHTPITHSHQAVAPEVARGGDALANASETLLKHLLEEHFTGLDPAVAFQVLRQKQHATATDQLPRPSKSTASATKGKGKVAQPHRHHHSHTPSTRGHPYGVHPRNKSTRPLNPDSHLVVDSGPKASTSNAAAGGTTEADRGIPTQLCKWRDCGRLFHTTAELMHHLSSDHVGSGKPMYSCYWDTCDRCVENGAVEESVEGKKEIGKAFTQRQKIMRHLQTHTGDRPFICDVCSKSFSENTSLISHRRIHTTENGGTQDDKPYKCTVEDCASAFAEPSDLSKHVKTHKGEKPHRCDFAGCGKSFAKPDQLVRHQKIHTRDG